MNATKRTTKSKPSAKHSAATGSTTPRASATLATPIAISLSVVDGVGTREEVATDGGRAAT